MRQQLARVLREEPEHAVLVRRQMHGCPPTSTARLSRSTRDRPTSSTGSPGCPRDGAPRAGARAARRSRTASSRSRLHRRRAPRPSPSRRRPPRDDDRRVAPRPQLAADVGAAAVGQQQVEDDGVGRPQAASASASAASPPSRRRSPRRGGSSRAPGGSAARRRRRGSRVHRRDPMRGRLGRQRETDARAAARTWLERELPPLTADEPAGDREAEPGATRRRRSHERLEEPRRSAASIPGPGRAPEHDRRPPRRRASSTAPAALNFSAFSIRLTRARCICPASTLAAGARPRRRSDALAGAASVAARADQLLDRPELGMRHRCAGLQPRQVEQVLDDPARGARSRARSCRATRRGRPPTAQIGAPQAAEAASIVASGVRRSCETARSTAVLIASVRRRASASSASPRGAHGRRECNERRERRFERSAVGSCVECSSARIGSPRRRVHSRRRRRRARPPRARGVRPLRPAPHPRASSLVTTAVTR